MSDHVSQPRAFSLSGQSTRPPYNGGRRCQFRSRPLVAFLMKIGGNRIEMDKTATLEVFRYLPEQSGAS